MAKKPNHKPQQAAAKPVQAQPQPAPIVPQEKKPLSLLDFKVQAIIVCLLAFILYINTTGNEYAHDDGIVIVKNEYVQEGFDGLHKIFTRDAYDSYYKQLNTVNQLAGGRYRPLSIATFAIEQQFFGAIPEEKIDSYLHQNLSYGIRGPAEKKLVSDMHVRHFFNVVWYMLCVLVLLWFLRTIVLKDHPLIALVAVILFTIHPIHTEVVANVKSRDEIMSLLFMCLTMIFAFKFQDYTKQTVAMARQKNQAANNTAMAVLSLMGALLCYFLAFLSKEYAITLLFLLPFSFYLFRGYDLASSIKATLPYLIVLGLYILIRIKVAQPDDPDPNQSVIAALFNKSGNADKEILNNPYFLASPIQKLATEIASSVMYLRLLIWPQPLSADYSYNSIPYKDFGSWQVWFSLLVHGSIIAGTIYASIKRNAYKIFAFAGAFYMLHLMLVNNIVFNIGATLGERLIFHSSVGFCIVAAWLLVKGAERIGDMKTSRAALAAVVTIVVVLCGYKTMSRNLDWKNDKTLFMEDIKTVPNSVLVNGNVAASLITIADQETDDAKKKQQLHNAIGMLKRAITIHGTPAFVAGYLNEGIAYYKLGILDSAKTCLDSVRANYPNYPTLKNLYFLLSDYYMKRGWNEYGKVGKYVEAAEEFKKGLAIDSTNSELWYNLGGAYFSAHQFPDAVKAWQKSLTLQPNNQQAMAGLRAAQAAMNGGKPSDMPNTAKQPH